MTSAPASQKDSSTVYMSISSDLLNSLDIRSRTILHCCTKWYCQDYYRSQELLNILQRKAGYSLRIIDWMVTNYCKRFPLVILYNGNPINIHSDYERHLSVYNKRYYDPFARREKIKLKLLGTEITSTVGQLNFFKWFIERNLDHIVRENQAMIEQDMKNGTKSLLNAGGTITMHHGEFSVGFV